MVEVCDGTYVSQDVTKRVLTVLVTVLPPMRMIVFEVNCGAVSVGRGSMGEPRDREADADSTSESESAGCSEEAEGVENATGVT